MNPSDAIRVILADDHPSLRAGVRERLSAEPDIIIVAEAAAGPEALSLTLQITPDVLILDMEMPGMNGLDVALRLAEAGCPTRVLALSAYDSEHYVEKLLEAGGAGYLTKNESLDAIVAAVRGVAQGEIGWLSREAAASLIRDCRNRQNRAKDDPTGFLSAREKEVLRLVADGKNNQQIAEALFISESTVKKHINNIYFKLDMSTRAELVAWAWRQGLMATWNSPA
jgi:DNA-binding NarL/FixJ family response regulator